MRLAWLIVVGVEEKRGWLLDIKANRIFKIQPTGITNGLDMECVKEITDKSLPDKCSFVFIYVTGSIMLSLIWDLECYGYSKCWGSWGGQFWSCWISIWYSCRVLSKQLNLEFGKAVMVRDINSGVLSK